MIVDLDTGSLKIDFEMPKLPDTTNLKNSVRKKGEKNNNMKTN